MKTRRLFWVGLLAVVLSATSRPALADGELRLEAIVSEVADGREVTVRSFLGEEELRSTVISVPTAELEIDWARRLRPDALPELEAEILTETARAMAPGYAERDRKHLELMDKYESCGRVPWKQAGEKSNGFDSTKDALIYRFPLGLRFSNRLHPYPWAGREMACIVIPRPDPMIERIWEFIDTVDVAKETLVKTRKEQSRARGVQQFQSFTVKSGKKVPADITTPYYAGILDTYSAEVGKARQPLYEFRLRKLDVRDQISVVASFVQAIASQPVVERANGRSTPLPSPLAVLASASAPVDAKAITLAALIRTLYRETEDRAARLVLTRVKGTYFLGLSIAPREGDVLFFNTELRRFGHAETYVLIDPYGPAPVGRAVNPVLLEHIQEHGSVIDAEIIYDLRPGGRPLTGVQNIRRG